MKLVEMLGKKNLQYLRDTDDKWLMYAFKVLDSTLSF